MKIFSAIVFFVVMATAGCGCDEQPYELWIDGACSPGDQEVIRDSVATVNAWTRENVGEALIEIGGVDAVDHTRALTDERLSPNSGKRDFVVCLLREEIPADQLERWEPLFGWAVQSGNIILLIEPLKTETFRRRVLHEIGHFIGLSHVPKTDKNPAVMHPHPDSDEYTSSDLRMLCENYVCRGGAR
jgi:hypothetical protein